MPEYEAVADGSRDEPARRVTPVRDGVGVGLATAAYGISFGALAVASGLDVW